MQQQAEEGAFCRTCHAALPCLSAAQSRIDSTASISLHLPLLQTLRHALVPASLPPHAATALRLLLARLRSWPSAGQLELGGALKGLVFSASVGSLFGERFLQRCLGEKGNRPASGSAGAGEQPGSVGAGAGASAAAAAALCPLAATFFEFEEGFELSASPVPHIFQPRFLRARRRLLAALRQGRGGGRARQGGRRFWHFPAARPASDLHATEGQSTSASGGQSAALAPWDCNAHMPPPLLLCRAGRQAGEFEGTVVGQLTQASCVSAAETLACLPCPAMLPCAAASPSTIPALQARVAPQQFCRGAFQRCHCCAAHTCRRAASRSATSPTCYWLCCGPHW